MAGSSLPKPGNDGTGSGNSKTTSIGNNDGTSYINMIEVDSRPDASLIGSHCQYEYCRQLDFLPFFCQSCRMTFCLDHRSETAHQCAKAGAWAERQRQAQLARPSAGAGRTMRDFVAEKPCASPACKTVVGTSLAPGVHCTNCQRDYCLKHRLREDHNCDKLAPIGARPGGGGMDATAAAARAGAKAALDRLRAWGAAKREQAGSGSGSGSGSGPGSRSAYGKRPSATARAAALAELKKTAKGDAKLAPEKRLYLYVEAEAGSTQAKLSKGRFFYAKDWVVGRVLDAAARDLQIANVNNQSNNEEKKLRVFHVEGGRLLDFNEKVGTALASGNTIVLLRGVGPPPSLLEL